MAKSAAEKKAEADAKKIADDAIFGGQDPVRTADEMGVVQPNPSAPDAPVVTKPSHLGMTPKTEETITIDRKQFEAVLERLGDLESVQLNSARAGEDKNVFNPLSVEVKERNVRIAFHGDALVVGYKEKIRPDGHKTYTWVAKDQASGEIRTYVTLLLLDEGASEVREETIDYIAFIEGASVVEVPMVEKKDVGEIVEQGYTNQTVWDGQKLVETNQRIMTGAKEQRFIITVNYNGKEVKLPQEVVNIKS